MFKCALRDAESLCCDADTTAVQCRHSDFEALPFFAEHIFLRDTDIIENQLRGRGRANAHFIVMITKSESFPAFFNNERRNASGSDIRRRHRENNISIRFRRVSDKNFTAVEQPVVSFVDRCRFRPAGI